MDDGRASRHAPDHMPPPDATGAPQQARDAPLHGDPRLAAGRTVSSPPRITRGGWSAGGMAIPALLVAVAFLMLAALLLR